MATTTTTAYYKYSRVCVCMREEWEIGVYMVGGKSEGKVGKSEAEDGKRERAKIRNNNALKGE